MSQSRPTSVKGNWADGEWAGQEFEFRETLEYLDDPEDDIDDVLRATAERYGHLQDSYSAYLESSYWRGVHAQAVARAGGKCKCGEADHLQVHHKKYCKRYTEHLNMDLLEVVCPSCHAQAHGENTWSR